MVVPNNGNRLQPGGVEMTFQSGEEEWVFMSKVASGDEAAIAELYDAFGALVFKSARQVLTRRAEAEDAVQEIFIQLWKTADRFDFRRARLVTWVMLLTRRHLIDKLRRKGSRPETLGFEADNSSFKQLNERSKQAEQPMVANEGNQAIRTKIADLPELQREVIERAYLKGFTLREVSEQMNVPLGTIKSALSRGLGRLRERMGGSAEELA
ncbi:MAG: sigma-70 family RNA polymerase sigma factor [Actinobacteria bacterium]|nr:MAG: sigma-70 family RNA polymerase sigma factor [Actinomycetota bacterium]